MRGLSLDGASHTLVVVSNHATDLCPGPQFLICVVKGRGWVDLSPKTLSEDLGNSRGRGRQILSPGTGAGTLFLPGADVIFSVGLRREQTEAYRKSTVSSMR